MPIPDFDSPFEHHGIKKCVVKKTTCFDSGIIINQYSGIKPDFEAEVETEDQEITSEFLVGNGSLIQDHHDFLIAIHRIIGVLVNYNCLDELQSLSYLTRLTNGLYPKQSQQPDLLREYVKYKTYSNYCKTWLNFPKS